jgi:hypothetical protein
MPNTFLQATRTELNRTKVGQTELGRTRSKLDWAIIASILLMLAFNAVALFGDLGPSTAYAAVPM